MRALLIIFVALVVVAGGGGYYWLLQQQEAARLAAEAAAPVEETAPSHDVYAPAANVFAGTILKPEHLINLPMDEAAMSAEMIPFDTDGEALLIGSVARQTLPAGVPIARSAVVQPGDRGFLAAVLPQGKRAISIPITEVAGLSGLVMPGDRVDILLTYTVASGVAEGLRDVRASETVLSNIRVLALDQRMHQSDPATGAPLATTATLQVSPREAEMVTLATSLGELSMVLNSVHDGGDAEAELAEASAEITLVSGGETPLRRLTLDSDVTSLLLRQSDAALESVAVRNQRIQIVRGRTSGDVELDAAGQAVPSEPEPQEPTPIAPDANLGAAYAGAPLETEVPIE